MLSEMSSTVLAFVGDAVFTLYVRAILAKRFDYKSGELTLKSSRIVSAVTQAKIIDILEGDLSDEEREIVRRCRNTHTNNVAKNATVAEYHKATGLEGVLGYLYLSEQKERLDYLLNRCINIYETIKGNAKK